MKLKLKLKIRVSNRVEMNSFPLVSAPSLQSMRQGDSRLAVQSVRFHGTQLYLTVRPYGCTPYHYGPFRHPNSLSYRSPVFSLRIGRTVCFLLLPSPEHYVDRLQTLDPRYRHQQNYCDAKIEKDGIELRAKKYQSRHDNS